MDPHVRAMVLEHVLEGWRDYREQLRLRSNDLALCGPEPVEDVIGPLGTRRSGWSDPTARAAAALEGDERVREWRRWDAAVCSVLREIAAEPITFLCRHYAADSRTVQLLARKERPLLWFFIRRWWQGEGDLFVLIYELGEDRMQVGLLGNWQKAIIEAVAGRLGWG